MTAVALALIALLAANTVGASAVDPSSIPEEDYDFLSVTDGTCLPNIAVGIDPKYEAECRRMTEPKRYRGRWYVAFETSYFTPAGMQSCIETKGLTDCAELVGSALPWPGRWDCAREYEVEFIGRRNALPRFFRGAAYEVVVDELISAKRLPDPYDENCDPELHPELKAKR